MTLTEVERLFLLSFSRGGEAKQLRELLDRIIIEVKDDVIEEVLTPKEAKVVIQKLTVLKNYLGLEAQQTSSETTFI